MLCGRGKVRLEGGREEGRGGWRQGIVYLVLAMRRKDTQAFSSSDYRRCCVEEVREEGGREGGRNEMRTK